MLKTYKIKPGITFRLDDGTLKGAGETVQLPTDVAAAHAASVDEVKPDTEEQPSADPA